MERPVFPIPPIDSPRDTLCPFFTRIYSEEVTHVAYGSKWFNFLCGRDDKDPKQVFHALVRKYFKGNLKPPFNDEKRADAGIPPDFYWPLTENIEYPAFLGGKNAPD